MLLDTLKNFVRSFIRSLARSLVRSIVRSFIIHQGTVRQQSKQIDPFEFVEGMRAPKPTPNLCGVFFTFVTISVSSLNLPYSTPKTLRPI